MLVIDKPLVARAFVIRGANGLIGPERWSWRVEGRWIPLPWADREVPWVVRIAEIFGRWAIEEVTGEANGKVGHLGMVFVFSKWASVCLDSSWDKLQ
jgi:hypothetical protein